MNIRRTRHQNELCQQYNLGMFYFKPPSKNGLPFWEMVKIAVKHWEEINKIAISNNKPFAFKISPTGGVKELS
jgi:hypothetical protein